MDTTASTATAAVPAPPTGLRVPDVVNPDAIMRLLTSTGVEPDPTCAGLLAELADLAAGDGAGTAADRFLAPGHADPGQRWATFVAAHAYDGDAPDTLARPPWTLPAGQRGRPLTRHRARRPHRRDHRGHPADLLHRRRRCRHGHRCRG